MSCVDTALVVEVPAAEEAVGRWRTRFDPAATWGVPAHVTVLHPFLPWDEVDEGVVAAVADVVGRVPAFDVTFATTGRFGAPGGPQVLWLAPGPAGPFAALTRALWRRFPTAPPYGGAFGDDPATADVTPHLTVADRPDPADLEAAARDVGARLPLTQRVAEVSLLAGHYREGGWSRVRTFPLGTTASGRA